MQDRGQENQLKVPEVSPIPDRAIAQLRAVIEASREHGPVALIGSSLGGYYAIWLAERYDCPAVMINPSIRPYDLLKDYLGVNTNQYTGETYEFTEGLVIQLRALDITRVTRPSRYLLMVQKGDAVLDYRQAVEKFPDSPTIIEEDGTHEFQGFERHLETVVAFCGIKS